MSKKDLSLTGREKAFNERKFLLNKLIVIMVVICVIFNGLSKIPISYADTLTSVTVRVDYIEELAYVTAGSGGSTKFYMSTDNQKSWEMIDDTGRVDISNILSKKAVTLYFKGNKDLNPAELILPAEEDNLEVTFSVVSGAGIIAVSSAQSVEYKKGEYGAWKAVTSTLIPTSIYEIKGATLYFRTLATTAKRAGKVKAVKIPKRPGAPSVKLDAAKLCITGLKSGESQYRVGDSTTWITFTTTDTKIKSITLQSLLSPTSTANTVIPAGRIEIRSMGNNKKLNSGVKVIEITQQLTAPENVALTGTTLTITDSNTKRAYEFTRVEKGYSLNLNTAKWSPITSKSSVIVPNASVGDKILVRLKSTLDTTTKQPILASAYKELTVTSVTIK